MKLNTPAQARVIVLKGGAEDGVAGNVVGEGVVGVDVLVVSSSSRMARMKKKTSRLWRRRCSW
jgi:hypothetical protein